MSTSFLPVCSTSWPGPWPRTSAEGEYTRRNSYESSKRAPSSNVISMPRDLLCSLISVGTRAMRRSCTPALRGLEGHALVIDAALEQGGEDDVRRRFADQLDHPARLEPAVRDHERLGRAERRRRRQQQRG